MCTTGMFYFLFRLPFFYIVVALAFGAASFCKGYCGLRLRESLQPHQEQRVQATRLKLECLLH